MRKIKWTAFVLAIALVVTVLAADTFAAGTSSIAFSKISVMKETQRVVVTISWTDDTAGTTASIVPASYGIEGWYLYSAETNPGSGPPTSNYDITLIDADGVDIAGGTLLNRHTTTTELVNVGTATHGYPVIRGTITFTLSGNSQAGATGTCVLTFVAN